MTNRLTSPEFTQKTKDKLKDRVAGLCSNPNHKVSTQAAKGNELVNNMGKAAHIAAANKGGPRFDERMTNLERKHIKNGIWLCGNCHDMVDNDPDKYTKVLLLTWRAAAEGYAMVRQGKKPIENKDVQEQISTLLYGAPTSFQQNSITNVHKGVELALEKLDPRFTVKSYRDEQGPRINLIPKESVELTFNVNTEKEPSFPQNFDSFEKHGQDLVIPGSSFSIKGSKLHEEILKHYSGGDITFKGRTINAVLKIKLINEESGEVLEFDDIVGPAKFGTESFTFKGIACQGMFQYICKECADKTTGTAYTTVSLEQWEGTDIRYLGHFQKLRSFISKLYKGWKLIQYYEINGIPSQESKAEDLSKHDMIEHLYYKFEYIGFVSEIARVTNQRILFNPIFKILKLDFDNLRDLVNEIKGARYKRSKIGSWKCGFTIMKSSLEEYSKKSDYQLRLLAEPIKCFDQEFLIPECRRNLINFDFEVVDDSFFVDSDECVKCQLVPNKESIVDVKYIFDDKQIK